MEPAETTTTTTTTEAPPQPASDPMLVAGYPLWVVGLVLGLALVLVFWLLSCALRVLAALLALAVLAAASWVAWQHVFG